MSDFQEIRFSVRTLGQVSEKFRDQHRWVRAHRKNVILVNTQVQFASPNETTTQFIKIAAFGENHISIVQSVPLHFTSTDLDRLHFAQIEVTILHVGHAQIGDFNRIGITEFSAFRGAGLHLSVVI
ncbi:hypothetical protein AQZ49_06595 [Novosphingobium sp. FSW06-99]|nr:hypothetical protein AQZ49_06595 [Novosphingobium sp. FSW06-99]